MNSEKNIRIFVVTSTREIMSSSFIFNHEEGCVQEAKEAPVKRRHKGPDAVGPLADLVCDHM